MKERIRIYELVEDNDYDRFVELAEKSGYNIKTSRTERIFRNMTPKDRVINFYDGKAVQGFSDGTHLFIFRDSLLDKLAQDFQTTD